METKELEKEFLTMIEAQKRTIYKVCYIYANDQDDLNDFRRRCSTYGRVSPAIGEIAHSIHGYIASR